MAQVLWVGQSLAQLLEDFPAEVRFDLYGVAGGALYYSVDYTAGPALVQQVQTHPDFNWLKRTKGVLKREEANLGKVVIDFEGVPPGTDDKQYKLSGSTSSEPIETHPKFQTKIGGQPGARLNNSVFNQKDGTFKGFSSWVKQENSGQNASTETGYGPTNETAPAGSILNPKAGVKSYLSASLVYEETWTRGNTSTTNDLSELGYISIPPTSQVFPYGLASGRTWLLARADITPAGFGTKLVRSWRLSGFRGWDTDIYNKT